MIAHAFRLVWNRRRANVLVAVEMLLSFLVLCGVASVAVAFVTNWRAPLGFEYRDVWVVEARPEAVDRGDAEAVSRQLEAARAVVREIEDRPEVVAVTPANMTPYSDSVSRYGLYHQRRLVQFLYTVVTPAARDVLDLPLVAGRFLADGDARLPYRPVVVNEALARRLFGDVDPIGRSLPHENEDGSARPWDDPRDELRVVGVVAEYRKGGELSLPGLAAFVPMDLEDPRRADIPWAFLVRVAPGTEVAFEERLLEGVSATAPKWSFRAERLAEARRRAFEFQLLPLGIAATVVAFLLLTAGMGLLGVLWQNVARRTSELGVRRAFGATAGGVQALVMIEVLALTTLAVSVGCALFLQLPALGVFPEVPWSVYATAVVAALMVMYAFVAACGLYPSWLATRVRPAAALRDE